MIFGIQTGKPDGRSPKAVVEADQGQFVEVRQGNQMEEVQKL